MVSQALVEVRQVDNKELTDTVNKLKKRIIEIEAGNNDLSETDTRQGWWRGHPL